MNDQYGYVITRIPEEAGCWLNFILDKGGFRNINIKCDVYVSNDTAWVFDDDVVYVSLKTYDLLMKLKEQMELQKSISSKIESLLEEKS